MCAYRGDPRARGAPAPQVSAAADDGTPEAGAAGADARGGTPRLPALPPTEDEGAPPGDARREKEGSSKKEAPPPPPAGGEDEFALLAKRFEALKKR